MDEVLEIIKYHKEKCFRCGEVVEKQLDGTFKCKCGFEWANLFIKRIPVDVFRLFKEYADANFCSDYGFCLKELMDKMVDSEGMRTIFASIQDMTARLDKLENNPRKAIFNVAGQEIIRK